MKGVVFSEFLEFVEARHGADMVDDIIDASGASGAYTTVGTYPHAELVALATQLCQRTGQTMPEMLRRFGRHMAGVFERSFAEYFARSNCLFEFLASVDDHIHIEVRKLYPDAELPAFDVTERDARHLVLDYRSPRRMEALAVGLIEGAADRFGASVDVSTMPLDDGGTRIAVRLA